MLVVIVLLLAGPCVAWKYGPMQRVGSTCIHCGRWRHREWRVGIKIRDEISETDCSRWVDSLYPSHRCHVWGMGSVTNRWRWFGGTECGRGREAVADIHQVQKLYGKSGKDVGEQLLKEYYAALAVDPSERNRKRFEFEEVLPALSETEQGSRARFNLWTRAVRSQRKTP